VRGVRVTIDGSSGTAQASHGVVVDVFALPWHNGNGVRFTYLAAPHAPVVAVFNGTRVDELGLRTRASLERDGFRPGPVETYFDQTVPQTRVLYAPGRQPFAESVRHTLHAGTVGRLDAPTQALLGSRAADVIVVAGEDLARRR
jgi:LytR cell envelope-related transcriptional attenuator